MEGQHRYGAGGPRPAHLHPGEPSADTTVNVVVREKPSVTVNEVSNGTVDVTYTLDGETVQPSENGYVYTGTGISVTLAPATGYVVNAGAMEATYGVDVSYTDSSGATTDNMTYTIDNVQSDVTIAPVWEQLAACTVGYCVVDTIGNGSGHKRHSVRLCGAQGHG